MSHSLLLFIFDSPTQIIFVIAILVLLFGAGRLPQLAKSLGQSRKAFKDALREGEEEEERERAAHAQVIPPSPAQITPAAPHLMSQMTDEELEAEMKRRSEMRAEH